MPNKRAGAAGAAAEAGEKKPTPRRKRAPASKASDGAGAKLRVKQVRSGIGHAETYRRTLRALGLRHYQDVVELADTPSARGMLRKVRHLVRVEAGEG